MIVPSKGSGGIADGEATGGRATGRKAVDAGRIGRKFVDNGWLMFLECVFEICFRRPEAWM